MNTAGWRSTLRPDTHQVKPTAAIRAPKLLSGRRYQANSPVPMNDQPMSGPKTAVSAGSLMSSGADSAEHQRHRPRDEARYAQGPEGPAQAPSRDERLQRRRPRARTWG